ncbi:glycoside hydrolase superfamily [Podospora aff. communis PSN243]|uniref:xylan 1,4-beta-xylosidase n=1 Tax=Podospora aff. communis PSN243 TaxID=3040156 RepID=A0AAV9G782_9PEZI|nr:glycoside hydrolase superfamily [Podospora aff. communis PSN243]
MAVLAISLLLAALTPVQGGVKYPDCTGGPLRSNKKLANLVNNAPGISRLGLSAYQWWNEALHGVAHNRGISWAQSGQFSAATQFPQAITTGAAFDDALIEQIGVTISTEARAFANAGRAHLDFWTPDVNPFRDPRWGRGHETPGEDPYLNARWAAAFVKGMQGPGPTHRVVATCKHYAAYDLENSGSTTRFNFNAKVTMQDLVEYYLPPFRQCARDSKVGSIMCSYNAVNGVPACADPYLLDTILRKHWNWTDENQYVVSDCDAVYYLGNANRGHRYKSSYAAAIGASMEAGCDNMCWATDGTQPNAAAAFNAKHFTQQTLDQAMVRQFQGLVKAGYFDGPNGMYRNLGPSDVNTSAAQKLALRAAEAGIVLLKNDNNFLPVALNTTGTQAAMIGFWANAADKMLGGYSGTPPFRDSPVSAARTAGITVNFATGPLTQSSFDASAAVSAAQKSSVVIFFAGIDNTVEKESQDRTSISWPAGQLSLLTRLSGLNKPIVVVKLGTHMDDTPILALPNVKAILWAGYPGQSGGTAVMNSITGVSAPAGRLPVTMYPSSFTSAAPYTNMALRPGTTGNYPGRTYRWYKTPVFGFGHGLHYTNFSVSVPSSPETSFPKTFAIEALLSACKSNNTASYLDLCPFPSLPLSATNTGATASDYVALAFVKGEYGPQPYPIKTLAAYERISGIKPGEARAVELKWNLGSLARVNERGDTVLYPGKYTVLIDTPVLANLSFTLTGEEAVLDRWPQA